VGEYSLSSLLSKFPLMDPYDVLYGFPQNSIKPRYERYRRWSVGDAHTPLYEICLKIDMNNTK